VRTLSDRALERAGLTPETSNGNIKLSDELVSTATGETRPVARYVDNKGNVLIKTDPGWSYNPGRSAFHPDMKAYQRQLRVKFQEYLTRSGNFASWVKTGFTFGGSKNIPPGFAQRIGPSVLPDSFFDKLKKAVPFTINKSKNSLYSPALDRVEIGYQRFLKQSNAHTAWWKKRAAIHEYSHAFHFHNKWITFDAVHPKIRKVFERAHKEWEAFTAKDAFKGGWGEYDKYVANLKSKFGDRYEDTQLHEFVSAVYDTVAALTRRQYGAGHSAQYFSHKTTPYMEFLTHSAETFFQENPALKEILPGIHDLMIFMWTDYFSGKF
jgi:hypothetical protein